MKFYEKLNNAWRNTGSMVCVGLDPDINRLPESIRNCKLPFFEFNRRIIDATLPHAAAYKPQFAYYAGEDRTDELLMTMDYLRKVAPDRVIILDAKRGDIGSTASQYAREAFEVFNADAVTVNPYMGGDTLVPFTAFTERGTVVLCKTSNPGSAELQDCELRSGKKLFMEVAEKAASKWNGQRNLALVIGATYPGELKEVRAVIGDMPLLIPGIGAQGGDLEATLKAGLCPDGWGLLINSARGILYASTGADFAEAAAAAASDLKVACQALQKTIFKTTER